MSIRDILAENFRKLREATPSLSSPKDIIKAEAASNGTIGRISKRETGISIDKLEALASAYGVEVWQLLSPSLKASKSLSGKPVVTGLPDWPFPMIDKESYMALDDASQIAVQVRMRDVIKEELAEQMGRKANGTR